MTEGNHQRPDIPAPHPGDSTGISDDALIGDASEAARSVLGDQDPTNINTDPLIAKLDDILATPVDIDSLSPALAERFDSLTPEEVKKAFILFGHQVIATEVELDETKAELNRVNISHDQQVTAMRDRHEKRVANITEDAAAKQEELHRKATTDSLTGLLNRPGFIEEYEAWRQFRGRRNACIAYMDLDGFKAANDDYGHAVGDKVLVRTAEVMESVLRENDIVARLGGDEFAILLDGVEMDEGVAIVERIREGVKSSYVTKIGDKRLDVTASIGISPADGNLEASEALLASDDAMYIAKRQGRDKVVRTDLAHPDHIEPVN